MVVILYQNQAGLKMDLAELRKKLKKKNPEFRQRDAHKLKKLKYAWRRPKGIHNKLRMRFKGKGNSVSIGYRNPVEIRDLHPSGFQPIIVNNLKDLQSINKEKQGALLSSRLGIKSKIKLLKKAEEFNVIVLNVKDIKESIKKYEDYLKNKKLTKKQEEEKKKQREEVTKKETKNDEKELTKEEQAKKEESEKIKVLHQG